MKNLILLIIGFNSICIAQAADYCTSYNKKITLTLTSRSDGRGDEIQVINNLNGKTDVTHYSNTMFLRILGLDNGLNSKYLALSSDTGRNNRTLSYDGKFGTVAGGTCNKLDQENLDCPRYILKYESKWRFQKPDKAHTFAAEIIDLTQHKTIQVTCFADEYKGYFSGF